MCSITEILHFFSLISEQNLAAAVTGASIAFFTAGVLISVAGLVVLRRRGYCR